MIGRRLSALGIAMVFVGATRALEATGVEDALGDCLVGRDRSDAAHGGVGISMTPSLEFIPENGGGAGIRFRKRKT